MSAIIKLHTSKNKNSLWQHNSCSVQTQDHQISLRTRNIFCLALKLPGQGEQQLHQLRAGTANTTLNASLPPATRGLQLRPAATKHNKVWTWFIQEKRGCSSLEVTAARSSDHFTGVTGKLFLQGWWKFQLWDFSHTSISDSALHQEYFHCYSCPEDTALL